MKKVNFKISVMAISIGIFALTSCGGRNSNKQSGDASETKTETKAEAKSAKGGAKLKDVSESNWQAVVKSNFGVDFIMPDGWTLKEVYSPNKEDNLKLFLNIGGTITGEDMGRQLFEATKALSPQGNYSGRMNWETETVEAGDVIGDFAATRMTGGNDIISQWCFNSGSKSVIINYYTMGNTAEYTFSINSTKP